MSRAFPIMVLLAAALMLAAGERPGRAGEPHSIRFGYVISLTGPNAAGAAVTQLSVYRMWAQEVNAAGRILLASVGRRLPVEVIEYDDGGSVEAALHGIERLVNDDKVDFVLPPWGTGTNLAVGQLLHDAGYPHLMLTAATDTPSCGPTASGCWAP